MSDPKLIQEIRDLAARLGVNLADLAPQPPTPPIPDPNDIVPGTVAHTDIYRILWRVKGEAANVRPHMVDFPDKTESYAGYLARLQADTSVEPGSITEAHLTTPDGHGWL